MKYLVIMLLLFTACATKPTDSFEACTNYCNTNNFGTATYVINEHGFISKRCNCYKSLQEALESEQ
jgi:hypothetical protein